MYPERATNKMPIKFEENDYPLMTSKEVASVLCSDE